MSINLKPIKDKVAVEFIEETENKTKGGIYLPDTSDKEKPQMGRIVAVGTDKEVTENVKPGDKILFGKYSGTEVKLEGKKYLILKYEDILAVIGE